MINILCDNALLIGYGLSQKRIDAGVLYEVVRDMGGSLPEKPNHPEPLRNPSLSPPLPHDGSPEFEKERLAGEKTFSLPSSLLTEFIHSLKSTLGSIKTTSQLLINQCEEVDSEKSYGRGVQKDIQNMDWSLDSLLHYIHLNTPIKKTNTVHTLLEEILKYFEKQLEEKKIRTYRKFQKDLPEAAVHDESLRYILASILQYVISRLSANGRLGFITKSSSIQKRSDRGDLPCEENGKSIDIFVVFTPLESPTIYGEDIERKCTFNIKGGVNAPPFLTGFTNEGRLGEPLGFRSGPSSIHERGRLRFDIPLGKRSG